LLESLWLRKRLHSISHRLTQFDLQRSDPAEDSLSELEGYLYDSSHKQKLFLNYYSYQGLIDALERYGTFERLRRRGFDPYLVLKWPSAERHILRLTDGKKGHLLIELVASLVNLQPHITISDADNNNIKLLAIEWLLLQNPRANFTKEKMRLPGQKHPGLGVGREVLTLLQIMVERLQCEGLLAFPQHYHNGLLYCREFSFFSPIRQGELKALDYALTDFNLAAATWAVEENLVFDTRKGKPYKWKGEEMLWPHSKRLISYFHSPEYTQATEQAMANNRFQVDPQQVEQMMKKLSLY
jgi:hypothetical protein